MHQKSITTKGCEKEKGNGTQKMSGIYILVYHARNASEMPVDWENIELLGPILGYTIYPLGPILGYTIYPRISPSNSSD